MATTGCSTIDVVDLIGLAELKRELYITPRAPRGEARVWRPVMQRLHTTSILDPWLSDAVK